MAMLPRKKSYLQWLSVKSLAAFVVLAIPLVAGAQVAAPAGLVRSAYTESPRTISLSWQDNANNETRFNVEKSSDGGASWEAFGQVGSGTTTFSGTLPTGFFSFRVLATDGTTASNPSNVISVEGTDPENSDTDGDTMRDSYEAAHGLDPYYNDAFEDLDGDRYPNIFECAKGSDVADPESVPEADYIADTSASPSGNVYSTIQGALDQVTDDYQVVLVREGVYSGSGNVNLALSGSHSVLLIGESGAGTTVLDGGNAARLINVPSGGVIDGITFRNGSASEGGAMSVAGGILQVVNCVFSGNSAVQNGGAIHQEGGNTQVVHSTFVGNTSGDEGSAVYAGAGEIVAAKSIFWNSGTAGEIAVSGTAANVEVTDSIVRGGFSGTGNLSSNPLLRLDGHIAAGSPAIDGGGTLQTSLLDMDGEVRPVGSTTDMGADEWTDTDSDNLPDWWELECFGSLSATGLGDPDEGGLTNRQEYETGSAPKNFYGQGGATLSPGRSIVSGDGEYAASRTIQVTPSMAQMNFTSVTSLFPCEGLALWLKADEGISMSGTNQVTAWADMSGNGKNLTQGTSSLRPTLQTNIINGKPVVRFDGTDDNLLVSSTTGWGTSQFSVTFLIKPNGNSNNNQKIHASGGWGQFYWHANANGAIYVGTTLETRITPGSGEGKTSNGTVTVGDWQTFTFTFDGSTGRLYKNGYLLVSKTMDAPATWTGFILGTADTGTINGDLAEVIVHSTALSAADVASVQKYLADKYGLNPDTDGDGMPDFYEEEHGLDALDSSDASQDKDGDGLTNLQEFQQGSDPEDFRSEGLTLWLKADAGVSVSGTNQVATWADMSGSGKNLIQGTSSLRPTLWTNIINGKPVVRFDGTDDNLSVSSTTGWGTSQFSATFLIKPNANSNYNQQIHATGGWGQFFWHANTNGAVYVGTTVGTRISPGSGAGKTSNGTVTLGDWQTFTFTFDGSTGRLYKNGYLLVSKTMDAPATWTGFMLGATNAETINGDLAEVIVHSTALSAADVASVQKYLAEKYELNPDTDGDGMPDVFEEEHGLNASNSSDASQDKDGDGLTNLQEFQQSSDPDDYFNGAMPLLQKVSGDNQSGPTAGVLPDPLVVKVMTSGSASLNNAPVVFSVSGSLGQIATSGTGTFASSQSVRADGSGLASVYLRLSGPDVALNQVQAQVTSGTTNVTVSFSATTEGPPAAAPTAFPPLDGIADVRVVQFSCATPNATIKYTVDGSDPKLSVLQCASGELVRVPRNAIIRAVASAAGYEYGAELTGSYSGRAQVSAGHSFNAALNQAGIIYTWGSTNTNGQLGKNHISPEFFPFEIPGETGAVSVATGSNHLVFAKDNATSKAAGSNVSGKLGINSSSSADYLTPTLASGSTQFAAVSAGDSHTLAITASGTIFSWGGDSNGQLGNGATTGDVILPTVISGTYRQVDAGATHSVAVDGNGRMVGWGSGSSGQLGNAVTSDQNAPVVSGTASGTSAYLQDVVQVSAGRDFSIALRKDGTVWGAGLNDVGQLGLGNTVNKSSLNIIPSFGNVVKISAGDGHALALKSDGTVFGWGSNAQKQLVVTGSTASYSTPTQLAGISNAVDISAGKNNSLILLADGSVIILGADSRPNPINLATRSPEPVLSHVSGNYNSPISVTVTTSSTNAVIHYSLDATEPTEESLTVSSGGTISVGKSSVLRVKAFEEGVQPSSTAMRVFSIGGRIFTDGGESAQSASIVVNGSGEVLVAGQNSQGKFGLGATPGQRAFQKVPSLNNVREIAEGTSHTLFLLADGSVYAAGYNETYGLLGTGTGGTNSATPVQVSTISDIVAVAASMKHNLALKSDGTVWAWGWNGYGQIGDGTTTTHTTPVQVAGLTNVIAIATTGESSLALKSDGTVWYWGSSYFPNSPNTPTLCTSIRDVRAISGNVFHILVTREDGTVWSLGRNTEGILGSSQAGIESIYREFIPVDDLTNIIFVAAGFTHSLAVGADGKLWSWGANTFGQLGISLYGPGATSPDTNYHAGEKQMTPKQVPVPARVIFASGGAYHSVATGRDSTTFWVWGRGAEGQLGLVYYTNQYLPALLNIGGFVDGDGDGLPDWFEVMIGTNPELKDSNHDGIDDRVSYYGGLDPTDLDSDDDGISNADEIAANTNPFRQDSDGDGVSDDHDDFPLDPTRTTAPTSNPEDHTAPTITLTKPAGATLVDP